MAAHTTIGYVLAVGVEGVLHGVSLGPALYGLAIWVVFLNGGTLAINSVFDRDEGDIGYLAAPPALPRHLLPFSLALLLGGQVLALRLPVAFQVVYAACLVLSLLYSVPPFRLKAVAGADWVINMWGFGSLTPYAAWTTTGRPLDGSHALVLLAFCPLFAGLYPLTQLYQLEEDRRRGDRTLALFLGMGRSLRVAVFATVLAFFLFGWGALREGVGSWGLLLLAPLAWWAWVLVPWYRHHTRWTPAQHQQRMYHALAAWALTDLAIVAVFAG